MTTTETQAIDSYLVELTKGEPAPLPNGVEPWADMLDRISVVGRIAEISEATYWHFLEVLPPQYMDERFFCFAEGMEPMRLFWRSGAQHFTRQLDWSETYDLCDLAGLPRDYYCY